MITISEIFTGVYLRKDYETATKKVRLLLGQINWINFDFQIAKKAGEINAYLIANGKKIDFQDVLIAATFTIQDCDFLLTFNKKHFERIPLILEKIYTPTEFEKFVLN
ncbi:MAG: type II toxin-antitoxin system VapC family toxin [Candidatus Helarchaeota archaeon]